MPSLVALTSRRAVLGYITVAVVAAVVVVVIMLALPSRSQITAYNTDSDKVAIHGYDTVAYFTEGQAIKGKSEFEYGWGDARWNFASADNRDLFTANPDRYAPQYGGYCALGLSAGEYAAVNPEAWTIVDGKLYLNRSKDFRVEWRKAPAALIGNADYNWENNRDQLRNNL